MPTPPDNVPWLAWAIVVVILALIAQIPVLVQSYRTRQDLKSVKADMETTKTDTAAVREQVQNTHTTNLRADMDDLGREMREGFASLREDVGGLHSETRDLRADVAGIRTDARQDRRAMASLRADVPEQIARAIESHTSDCPGRKPHP